MRLWYVEVSEVRHSFFSLRAASEEEAKEKALAMAKDGELEVTIYDREAIAVLHPVEHAA